MVLGLLSGSSSKRRSSDASSMTGSTTAGHGPRAASPDRGQGPPNGRPEDTEVLDDEEGSIIASMIGQCECFLGLTCAIGEVAMTARKHKKERRRQRAYFMVFYTHSTIKQ